MGIYQRKDSPFWWMVVETTGKRLSTNIPRDGGSAEQNRELKRQAQEVYAKAQARAAASSEGVPVAKERIAFEAFAEWFETHVIAHHRSAERERSMLHRLTTHFQRFPDLTQIDEHAIKEWMTLRAKTVARGTVNRELDVLKLLLKAAVPKYLERSPASEIRHFRVEETERRVLTVDEEARLLAVCNTFERAMLLMALDTLLRLSSVVNLKWAQVKMDRRVIIPLNAKVSLDAVPISSRLHETLMQLPRTNDYVFALWHLSKGRTSAKNQAIRLFDALCQKARIPHGRAAEGVTFHCLRHTGATRALQNGASVRTVMKLGGWKDERTVMRYLHASDSDVRAAAESIGAHVTVTKAS